GRQPILGKGGARPPLFPPPPIEPKAGSMPADHGLGSDDHECFLPLRPRSPDHHPEQAIKVTESGFWVFSLELSKVVGEEQGSPAGGCVGSGKDERPSRAEAGTKGASQTFIADDQKAHAVEAIEITADLNFANDKLCTRMVKNSSE